MTPTPPNFDRNPTRYDPDHSVSDLELPAVWPPPKGTVSMPDTTAAPAPAGFLTPGQRQYLFVIGLSFLIGWLGHLGITPAPLPPLPPELPAVIKAIEADVKEIKAAQVQAVKAARQ